MAQTTIKTPAQSTRLDKIFLKVFKVDCQSIGKGIRMRYRSVETLQMNETQMINRDSAAWQDTASKTVSED